MVRYRPSAEAEEQDRYLDITCAPIKPADGKVTGVFCQGHDVTERIKTERGKVVAECLGRLPEAEREAIIGALPALEALAGALKSVPAPRE